MVFNMERTVGFGRVKKCASLTLGGLCFLLLHLLAITFVPGSPVPLVRRLLAASNEQKRKDKRNEFAAEKSSSSFPRLWLSSAHRCVVNGSVSVDGVVRTNPVLMVDPSSNVLLRCELGCIEVPPQKEIYLKFFKPRGVISANSPVQLYSKRSITADFYPPGAPASLHNAGRLDGDSEGILLLTTDGHFSHFVTSPGSGFEKEYIALTNCQRDNKPPSEECLKSLLQGVVLRDGHLAKAMEASVTDFDGRYARLRIVVTEGRFRMVRRMLRGVGYGCMQLLRVRTCGIGDAMIRPTLLQEAAKESLQKAKPTVQPARLAQNSQELLPGEFAPIEAEEVARIYASSLPSV